jgi:hypothetical protein
MPVLETRCFRFAVLHKFDNVNLRESLQIAAHDTLVVPELAGECPDRRRLVLLEVVDDLQASIMEDIVRTLPGKHKRIVKALGSKCLGEGTPQPEVVVDIGFIRIKRQRIRGRWV